MTISLDGFCSTFMALSFPLYVIHIYIFPQYIPNAHYESLLYWYMNNDVLLIGLYGLHLVTFC